MSDTTVLALSPILERALLFVAAAVATLVTFLHWRRGDARTFRQPLIAFCALLFVEGTLFAAAANPSLLATSLVLGLDFAAIVLLAWAFLASSLSPRASGAWLGGGMTLAIALTVFSISVTRMAGDDPGWIGTLWSIASLILSGSTAITLVLVRSRQRTGGSIAAFAVLTLAAFLNVLLLPNLARAASLIAFSLFPIALYQQALSDLRVSHDMLREFGRRAQQQTQELVRLLESGAHLFTSLDLDELLSRAVEHASIGIDAERAIIVLRDASAPHTMRLGSGYPRDRIEAGRTFPFSAQPALALTLSTGEPLTIGPRDQGAPQLAQLLNMDRPGAMIVQPLSTNENTMGVLVAANPDGGRDFGDDQRRLLRALSAPIAAAIASARSYHSLEARAGELARALSTREREIGRYASILESAGDGILVADTSDQVIRVNSAAARLLDMPREGILHRPLSLIFEGMRPIDDMPGLATADHSIGVDIVRAAFEFGDRALQVSMAPVRTPDGERLGVIAIIRDITPEYRREESRAQFVASVAHELRTPLATIKGYADLLTKGAAGSLPAAARGFAETIHANAERLNAQVDAILTFSELDRGRVALNIEEIDIASILADAATACRARLEARGLSLDLRVRPNLPSVRADRARVRQVLDQLIGNAIKFTPDGGRVAISAAPSWDGRSTDRPAFVSVTVADSGVGFDREDNRRIFEAFYRGDHPPQVDQVGLGIGLTIGRGLCEAMGGHLWGRGEKGRGSTFTFILPVARVTDAHLDGTTIQETSHDSWIDQALSFLDDEAGGSAETRAL